MEKREIKEWRRQKGDETYILDHNLNENSVVVDLGAYKGVWAEQVHKKFKCKIYLLEPVKQFYNVLERKYINHSNINYKQVGIGVENKTLFLSDKEIRGDATKIKFSNNNNNKGDEINLITLENMMNYWNLDHIDLLQINIEGCEFDILENWLETGIINKIKTIQIQFHQFPEIKDHVTRRKNIQMELQKQGYKLKYCFHWVWECWEK